MASAFAASGTWRDDLYYGEGDEAWVTGEATVYDGFDLLGALGEP